MRLKNFLSQYERARSAEHPLGVLEKLSTRAQYGYGARHLCRFNFHCEVTLKMPGSLAFCELKLSRTRDRAPARSGWRHVHFTNRKNSFEPSWCSALR